MCTYLKNMAVFTHNQLKNKRFDEVQKAFDKTMSWIDSFIPMDSEVVKDRAEGSKTKVEGSSKRAVENLQQESTKKQKVDVEIVIDSSRICFTDNINMQQNIKNNILSNKVRISQKSQENSKNEQTRTRESEEFKKNQKSTKPKP
ncbi:hypothetical protein Tco_0637919 [Tanacetum coccineum]